jgi:hypothetical protein
VSNPHQSTDRPALAPGTYAQDVQGVIAYVAEFHEALLLVAVDALSPGGQVDVAIRVGGMSAPNDVPAVVLIPTADMLYVDGQGATAAHIVGPGVYQVRCPAPIGANLRADFTLTGSGVSAQMRADWLLKD